MQLQLGNILAGLAVGAFEKQEQRLVDRLLCLLPRLGLPTDLDRRLFPAEPGAAGEPSTVAAAVRAALALDKKRAGATVRFIALRRPGDALPLALTIPELWAALQEPASRLEDL